MIERIVNVDTYASRLSVLHVILSISQRRMPNYACGGRRRFGGTLRAEANAASLCVCPQSVQSRLSALTSSHALITFVPLFLFLLRRSEKRYLLSRIVLVHQLSNGKPKLRKTTGVRFCLTYEVANTPVARGRPIQAEWPTRKTRLAEVVCIDSDPRWGFARNGQKARRMSRETPKGTPIEGPTCWEGRGPPRPLFHTAVFSVESRREGRRFGTTYVVLQAAVGAFHSAALTKRFPSFLFFFSREKDWKRKFSASLNTEL